MVSQHSASGIFTQGKSLADHRFPFPCYVLDPGDHAESKDKSSSIHYHDMLQMIFDSDTILSCC